MKVLVDTHIFLWMNSDPRRLGQIEPVLRDLTNDIYLSAVSSWELAIKTALGRIELPEPVARYVPARMEANGLVGLPVEHSHALGVADLADHHADPFDRLLVSQALAEGLVLATADTNIGLYPVEVVGP